MTRILVLGTGTYAQQVARELNGNGVAGFLQFERLPAPTRLLGLPVLSRWTPGSLSTDTEIVIGLRHPGMCAWWGEQFSAAGIPWRTLHSGTDLRPEAEPFCGFLAPDAPEVALALQDLSHDVYHLPGYLQLCARSENAEPVYYLGGAGASRLLIPLLRRPVPADLRGAEPAWDLTSPYGYPSPLLSLPDGAAMAATLFEGFRSHAAALGAVSTFLRLHPLYPMPLEVLEGCGDVVTHGQTVTMDLQLDDEMGWKQTRQRHRTQIRQLERDGFKVHVDDWSAYDEFQRIYLDTMQRVGATSYYLFDREYFEDLRAALGERLHLVSVVSAQGRLAAAALFMRQSGLLQYHLSGTREEFLPQGPSKLMFHELRRWGRSQGLRFLHLGGGLGGSNEDPLFRFKAGFSSYATDFHSFRIVIDPERYDRFTAMRRTQEGPGFDEALGNFFPAYRKRLS